MKKLRARIAHPLLLAGLLSAPLAAHAAAPQSQPSANAPMNLLHNIITHAQDRMRKAHYRVTGRLVRIDAAGKRTNYNIAIKALGAQSTLRVLLDITSPPNARAHVLLVSHGNGLVSIQIAHPGDTAPTTVPYEQWVNGPLGSSFSYEDFIEAQYFWKQQTVVPAQTFGARLCDQLDSTPTAVDRTHYSQVRTWIDHAIGFPVYVEKAVKGTGIVKQYTYYGLRQTGGVWSATQVEAKLRGTPGSDLLIFERGSANAKLDDSEFDAVKLTQF
jgi:Outer membrane lipoprotein-sorting protein